jgi:uncharacterized protein YjiK
MRPIRDRLPVLPACVAALTLLAALALAACGLSACDGDTPPVTPTTPDTTAIDTLRPLTQRSLATLITEPSGLAWDARRGALLVVSDARSGIYLIRPDGALVGTIPVGGTDMEAVALTPGCDTIFIAEEHDRRIACCDTAGGRYCSFRVDVATSDNNALEGVTVGPAGSLYILNEKNPGMLLVYSMAGTELRRVPLSFAADYSDLVYDAARDCLWILSDESALLAKTRLDGVVIAAWQLPVTGCEGIAVDGDTMYIVNDRTAVLYTFRTP